MRPVPTPRSGFSVDGKAQVRKNRWQSIVLKIFGTGFRHSVRQSQGESLESDSKTVQGIDCFRMFPQETHESISVQESHKKQAQSDENEARTRNSRQREEPPDS